MDIRHHLPRRIAGVALVATAVLAACPNATHAAEPIAEQPEVVSGAVVALEALERWTENGDTAAYLSFLDSRDAVAATVARTLEMEPSEMVAAWASADLDGQTAVLAALSQLGVAYRRYASLPGEAFDCSGLTRYAWDTAGVTLERSSRSQFRNADEVSHDDARAGDLAWYPGHVMLYLGVGDAIVHSPTRGRTVEYQVLSDRRAGWVRFADPTPAD